MKNVYTIYLKRVSTYLLGGVFLCIVSFNKVCAQDIENILVPSFNSDARSMALAEANGSDISHPSLSILNPAILSQINQRSIAYNSFQTWSKDIYTMDIGYRTSTISGSSYMAKFQYLSTGFSKFNYLEREVTSQPDLERFQLALAYSYSLSPVISLGVMGTGYTAWNDYKATEHFNINIGAIYAPTEMLSYSLALRGIGYGLGYHALGNGSTVIVNKNLEERLEYGGSLYFPNQSDQQVLTLSASSEKLLSKQGLYYRFGLELIPAKGIAMRTGYLNSEDELGFTFGLGLNLYAFTLSYALVPGSEMIDQSHQIEFLIKF